MSQPLPNRRFTNSDFGKKMFFAMTHFGGGQGSDGGSLNSLAPVKPKKGHFFNKFLAHYKRILSVLTISCKIKTPPP